MKYSVFVFLIAVASLSWGQVDPSKDRRAEPPGAPVVTPTTSAPAPTESSKPETSADVNAKPKVQVSESYKALIKQLMQVTHTDKSQENVIDQIATNISKDAKDPVKAKKTAYDYFHNVISIDALLQDIAETYAQYFSQSELKKLVEFYKSPLGQKAASKMPEITKEMMMKSQKKMQLKMAEFNKEKSKMDGFK